MDETAINDIKNGLKRDENINILLCTFKLHKNKFVNSELFAHFINRGVTDPVDMAEQFIEALYKKVGEMQ